MGYRILGRIVEQSVVLNCRHQILLGIEQERIITCTESLETVLGPVPFILYTGSKLVDAER